MWIQLPTFFTPIESSGESAISSEVLIELFSVLHPSKIRAPGKSNRRDIAFADEDFKKPIIGIASTWSNVTPCNVHIDKLALEAEKGANELHRISMKPLN